MKIETNLAPRDDAFAGLNELFRSLFSGVVVETRIVRMRADSSVNRRMFPAEFDGTFERAAMRIARANIQNRRYTRRVCAFNNRITIRVKLRPINVRVRVREHLFELFQARAVGNVFGEGCDHGAAFFAV